MESFKYSRAQNVTQAVQLAGQSPTAQQGAQVRFVAGGTTLLDLMKLDVERPATVVDINRLPLDKIEALNPRAVVATHKRPENDDDPRIIEETRQYIRDFIRLNDATKTAAELYDKMLKLYPDRVNPGSLWSAAATAKAQS